MSRSASDLPTGSAANREAVVQRVRVAAIGIEHEATVIACKAKGVANRARIFTERERGNSGPVRTFCRVSHAVGGVGIGAGNCGRRQHIAVGYGWSVFLDRIFITHRQRYIVDNPHFDRAAVGRTIGVGDGDGKALSEGIFVRGIRQRIGMRGVVGQGVAVTNGQAGCAAIK